MVCQSLQSLLMFDSRSLTHVKFPTKLSGLKECETFDSSVRYSIEDPLRTLVAFKEPLPLKTKQIAADRAAWIVAMQTPADVSRAHELTSLCKNRQNPTFVHDLPLVRTHCPLVSTPIVPFVLHT